MRESNDNDEISSVNNVNISKKAIIKKGTGYNDDGCATHTSDEVIVVMS
jgi:hypothetical protein